MTLLKDMAVELNLTIIAALHQPSQEIWNLCDGIILLRSKEGKTTVTAVKIAEIPKLRK